ncbi:MAG: cobalamin-dependent protein, partial [Nanoarchaeota archaeon]
MKILLIMPNSESHYFVPPVGLGYVAAALKKKCFEVELIDGVKEGLTVEKLSEKIPKNTPDVIGISFFSCDFLTIKAYVEAIRKISANIIIILGGPHITGVREQIFADLNSINFAFIGETETYFPLFLEKLQKGEDFHQIPGLIWKEGEKVHTNPAYLEEDLDKVGIPAWELMDPRTYPKAPQGAVFRNWPIGTILTSRGCPYNCTYCAGKLTTGQRIRKRSIANIMEEVELLYNQYGV